jgi:hypothetical protein
MPPGTGGVRTPPAALTHHFAVPHLPPGEGPGPKGKPRYGGTEVAPFHRTDNAGLRYEVLVLAFLASLAVAASLLAQEARPGMEDYVIPEGTEFRLQLHTAVNSRTSREGDRIVTTLVDPVYVYDRAVLAKGVRVEGSVEDVTSARRKGHGGEMYLGFDSIELPNGEKLPIRGSLTEIFWSEHVDDMKVAPEGDLKGNGPSRLKQLAIVLGAAAAGGPVGVGIGVATGLGGLTGALLVPRGHEAELELGSIIGMRLDHYAAITLPEEGENGAGDQ